MKNRLSMTRFLQDEDVELLIAHCSTREEFMSGVKALAKTGYLIPVVVLQYCFEGN
jgi:phage terminase small subunit